MENRAYKFRIYPTSQQETFLEKELGLKRLYWNLSLAAKNADHFDIICRTAYQNFTKQDSADGYSCADLIERIRANIRQIIYFPSYNLDWNKVGYTNEQRARSLETRRSQMIERQRVVQSYLHNNNKMYSVHLSQRALARLISKETGYNARTVLEDIRSLMSQEAIKMSKKQETVESEEQSSSYLSYNNNKMYTVYTDDVQTLTCKQWCEKYNKSRSLYYKYKHKEIERCPRLKTWDIP